MRVLLINQNYKPDSSATAQYLADLAEALVVRGHQVCVLCAAQGYTNRDEIFESESTIRGVKVVRVGPLGGQFSGKIGRVVDAIGLQIRILTKLANIGRFDRVVVLTSPPMILCAVALVKSRVTNCLIHWAMDINPDQAIAAGWIKDTGIIAGVLRRLMRLTLRRCDRVISLDRFMTERLVRLGAAAERVVECSLWADATISGGRVISDESAKGKEFVVMYSGNMSLCHPLDTLLQAAKHFATMPSVRFVFIGGGPRLAEIERFRDSNPECNIEIRNYVARDSLGESLRSADYHVVSMGDEYIGIVHPSKIYGILAAGKPFAYIGPVSGPIAELVSQLGVGDSIRHGNVLGLVAAINNVLSLDGTSRFQVSSLLNSVSAKFSAETCVGQVVEQIERGSA